MESENQGQGGSYLLNPKTGKVKLLQQTKPATPHSSLPEDLTDDSPIAETPSDGSD
jgi:hypothetical protein